MNFYRTNLKIVIHFIDKGICDPGYHICNVTDCCDVNVDCLCDQNCNRNEAPNGRCSRERKLGKMIIFQRIFHLIEINFIE